MAQTKRIALPLTEGLDLGARRSHCCVLDPEGARIEERSIATTREAISAILERYTGAPVVLEASTSARWIAALAESQGHEVIIANPRDIPIVKASVRKCDRHDARLLAELGQVKPGLLSPVHLRSDRYQAVQTLLFARAQLVSQRTSLINFVRAEVRLLGFSLPDCSSKSFASKLGPSISDSLKQAINPLLEILAGIQTPAGSGDGSSIPAPSPG